MKTSTGRTIDECCGKPAGSFTKSLKEKSDYLKRVETEERERIIAARESRQLSWAA